MPRARAAARVIGQLPTCTGSCNASNAKQGAGKKMAPATPVSRGDGAIRFSAVNEISHQRFGVAGEEEADDFCVKIDDRRTLVRPVMDGRRRRQSASKRPSLSPGAIGIGLHVWSATEGSFGFQARRGNRPQLTGQNTFSCIEALYTCVYTAQLTCSYAAQYTCIRTAQLTCNSAASYTCIYVPQ